MAKTTTKTKCHKCKRYTVLVSVDFHTLSMAKRFADRMSFELPMSLISVWDDMSEVGRLPLYSTYGVDFYPC